MQKILIAEASAAQLREFATRSLGLEIAPLSNASQITGKMRAAGYDSESIFIAGGDDNAPPPVDHGPAAAPAEPRPALAQVQRISPQAARMRVSGFEQAPLVELTIGHGSRFDGRDDVPVGVNGTFIRIARQKRVAIPWPFYQNLVNATTGEARDSGDNDGNLVVSEVQNYPVNVHSLPTNEELEAWDALSRELFPGGEQPKKAA